ncbi:hypothetical protein AC629_01960 [Bradyrhizobium sp. NAS80.1]|uniref:hypothetical protein n=1 Tax=Bradyrhizobium sp. NAS80.1 TaxID=1680159 RepID=UPI00095E0AE1|nr:hypothetical protein [Bradyrhizobium sp. NAS80.1]OKO91734.1 hypothetical protein AC629_01960 [Bradyrhizobium sp. NAS80.1]
MSELEAFTVRGHQKIVEHYRQLRDSAKSDAERERFQKLMDEEEILLGRFTEAASAGPSRGGTASHAER